jgi:hypothetical protein
VVESRDERGIALVGAQFLTLRNLELYTTDTTGRWGIALQENGGTGADCRDCVLEDLHVHDFEGNQVAGLVNTRKASSESRHTAGVTRGMRTGSP